MDPDLDGLFESGFGLRLKQAVFVFAAIWSGAMIAGMSVLAGKACDGGKFGPTDVYEFFGSFSLMFGPWLVPNSMLLALFCSALVLAPDVTAGPRTWAVVIGAETIFGIAEGMDSLTHRAIAIVIAWVCCGILLGMMGMAFRFIAQWQTNRWARELLQIQVRDDLEESEALDQLAP